MLQTPIVYRHLHQHLQGRSIPPAPATAEIPPFIDTSSILVPSSSSTHLHHLSPPTALPHHPRPLKMPPGSLHRSHPSTSSSGRTSSSSDEIETGVWTSTDIPSDVTFGPFDGEFTLGDGMKDNRTTPYMLEVKFVNGRLISGPDAHPTRWLRFVSPARKEHEHNLEADFTSFPEDNGGVDGGGSGVDRVIVFRTTRLILKGEELLVWYSPRLAGKDGVPISVNRFKGKDGYSCNRCCSSFLYPNTLKAHMRFQCYSKDAITTTPGVLRHLRHDSSSASPTDATADSTSSNCTSAFHRVSGADKSSVTAHRSLHVPTPCCPVGAGIVAGPVTASSAELDCMESHARHHSASSAICRSSGSPATSPTNHQRALHLGGYFLSRLGSGTGSAFRPTAKVVGGVDTSLKHKDKEGFRVIKRSSSSSTSLAMGNSISTTPPSPVASKTRKLSEEPRVDEERKERRSSPDVAFSMDKVLGMPKVVGVTPRSPGAALAYLQVQRAFEKNYGMPTYDPVIPASQHARDMPSVAAIRTLHRGPLGLDPYTGYPYRFFPPPGFPAVARLPAAIPVHKHGEAFHRLAYRLPYPPPPGIFKYPAEPNATTPPAALLTPPPEVDLQKYATLERNLTAHAPGGTFPAPGSGGDPQFAYNQGQKSKRGHLCIYCGKLYSRKYGLKIHLRTHTGYKPLKCKVCLRPFGDPSNLNKHIRLHAEGDTPYRCEHCGKVLVRRRDLERHIRSRHPAEHADYMSNKAEVRGDVAATAAATTAAADASAAEVKVEVEEHAEDLTISDDIDEDHHHYEDEDDDEDIDCVGLNDDDDVNMKYEAEDERH